MNIQMRRVLKYENNQWIEIHPEDVRKGMIIQMVEADGTMLPICLAMSNNFVNSDGVLAFQCEYMTPDQI